MLHKCRGRIFPAGCSLMLALAAATSQAAASRSLGDLSGAWQLFVDDSLIANKQDVSRSYHAFEKHAGNPVLKADRPWEGSTVYLYGSVLPMEQGPGYRMWYHTWDGHDYRMAYATSLDGLRWDKPALGLIAYEGSSTNNLFLRRTHEDHNPQVIHTPWESDPKRHYTLLNYDYGRTPPANTVSGYYAAWSEDGIHWSDAPKNPVLPDPGDVGNFVWDPLGKRYLGFPKKFAEVRGFNRRCCGVSHTSDAAAWPPAELVLTPDEYDDRWVAAPGQHTDFYGLCGFAYESMYLGFLWIFRITDGKNDGPIFVELVSSRDGVHWLRQEAPRTPLLALGADGAWDDGMIFTPNHPLVEGDAIKLFYGGFDGTHGVDTCGAAIGLATLRKGGFVSLDAGETEGVIETRDLSGPYGTLALNFSARNGTVRVEVLDSAGAVLPGFAREACAPLSGDSVEQAVVWKDARTLPKDKGPLRLRFFLRNASLYGFRIL